MEQFTLRQRMDALFEGESAVRPDALKHFIDKIHANYVEACRAVVRSAAALISVWAVSYLVAAGFVREGSVSTFKVENVGNLLIAAPTLIGVIGYGFLGALSNTFILWDALQQSYKHFLPTAYLQDLEFLIAPPIITNTERLLNPGKRSRLERALFVISNAPTFVLIMFGPFVALIHVWRLAWAAASTSHAWVVGTAAVGLFFLAKGVLLLIWSLRLSPGGSSTAGSVRA